ncbi:beta-N-acetylhexosaminidase [Segnochrobactrum spirostomi]|uniref:beta-N-acetylhexosaminidase n=1 Tax=Segnochrobactrum spirostomi TaxID=2608987 RepID=A0A6A7Y6W4_9HYPH|nr:beta-N-acetylhexosaminidase [Segnochrobactrum spirostomi]MQT14445.1 beta-N-acetylhexosaminidase [Segnochrobactrum spirostomi]
MMIKAFITGFAGTALTADERAFLRDEQPWGAILFLRNCRDPGEIRDLVAAFRECLGRPDAPVLIDQEGGRVQRLKPPLWRRYPAGRTYGALHARDPEAGRLAARLVARLMADDLHALGINVDCLPVLDVPVPGVHDVIGDRAYAEDPETVIALGRAAAEGLLDGGVLPVMKHIPGHGRTEVDSHLALPVVRASRAELEAVDFRPFAALADLPVAMTAHMVFEAIDPTAPATCSAMMIGDIVRGAIGFQGLLLSDDLSMQALEGSLGHRAARALAAGCDIALHCNGKIDEMREVAAASPPLEGEAARRAAAALGHLRAPSPFDRDRAIDLCETLTGERALVA